MEMALQYLCSICSLIKRLKQDKGKFEPFQIDFCVKYKSLIKVEEIRNDDIIDKEIQEYIEQNDGLSRSYAMDLEDIHFKLLNYDMKYVNVKFNHNVTANSDLILFIVKAYIDCHVKNKQIPMDICNLLVMYVDNVMNYELTSKLIKGFNEFKDKYNFDPKYKRFIILVDKRKTIESGDDIWIYQPYGKDSCKYIPRKDTLSYWFLIHRQRAFYRIDMIPVVMGTQMVQLHVKTACIPC